MWFHWIKIIFKCILTEEELEKKVSNILLKSIWEIILKFNFFFFKKYKII